jgi:hypothetical protein
MNLVIPVVHILQQEWHRAAGVLADSAQGFTGHGRDLFIPVALLNPF